MNSIIITVLILSCVKCVLPAPNIVLIIADDLDLVLDGMTPLTQTKQLIANQGATYANCFVNSPICCPNRASILTGRYQHNHFTVNNSISGNCNSLGWQQSQEPNTFAAKVKQKMDYTTFYAGKYMNQYGNKNVGGASHVPLGWDWWAGLMGNSKYYDYSLSINGTEKKYGHSPTDYLTDVIAGMSVDFIKNQRPGGKPFLMVLAPPAPHAPFTPAARHNDRYKGTKAKRTPNFNTPRQKDKHWLVAMGPSPLPDSVISQLDNTYRRRWETLLAVDDLVANVLTTLQQVKLLNNTYIIFTSDNGYHVGQFSMPLDKRQPYETDIRVPLLVRGPGIIPSVVQAPVSSVDLYGTILDIAGIGDSPADGKSILATDLALDRTFLIEYRGERSTGKPFSGCPSDNDPNLTLCNKDLACKCQDVANNTYSCIRRFSPSGDNNLFCIFEDNQRYIEAYDLKGDAHQMNNIGYTMKRARRHRFRNRMKKIGICQGSDCYVTGSVAKI